MDDKDITKSTDVDALGLSGQVRQVQQTFYKAHKKAGMVVKGKMEENYFTYDKRNYNITFDEKGRKIKEQLFDAKGSYLNTYDERGFQIESIEYLTNGNLKQKTVHTFDDSGRLLEAICHNADGTLFYKNINKYDENGKLLENIHCMGKDDQVYSRSLYEYIEKTNTFSHTQLDGDGIIQSRFITKSDDQGKQTEQISTYTDEKMSAFNKWILYKYNEFGHCIQMDYLHPDGSLKNTCVFESYEYDSEGNRINTGNQDTKISGETEEFEYDACGNWIKKSTYYNTIPVQIYFREIIYFGDPAEKNLVPPLIETTQTMETNSTLEELSQEEAKWLVEGANSENFSKLRYYALKYKESPSVIVYTGNSIEAITLLRELKENVEVLEIYSNYTVWNNHEDRPVRYSLIFPSYDGYMLNANQIQAFNEDEYELPGNFEANDDGYVYFSQLELLRPSEASGKRDWRFESELQDYITKCTLNKKPDKPVINMIESSINGFVMRSHTVNDDFEINDLDLNYGQGFEKFHEELMFRFNSSKKGLVLFHGNPGTGKTYYIRHLLRKMVSNKKVVIYMPPNMVDHLVEPSFMAFIVNEVKEWSEEGYFCVLLIEDAEPLLAKRQEGVRIQGVTNLLNMSDGLLNDMLNLQIICTFNVDLRKLDSALLRPGRLIARKEFKALDELDANLLAQRLGIKHHFTAPATLSEIYAMRKNKNTLVHDVKHDSDASTNIDDLF